MMKDVHMYGGMLCGYLSTTGTRNESFWETEPHCGQMYEDESGSRPHLHFIWFSRLSRKSRTLCVVSREINHYQILDNKIFITSEKPTLKSTCMFKSKVVCKGTSSYVLCTIQPFRSTSQKKFVLIWQVVSQILTCQSTSFIIICIMIVSCRLRWSTWTCSHAECARLHE